ncbi:MAG: aa3-type cytochrome oxidase subunit CtaJ [Geodermatophilaceae bacterium]
MTVVETLLIYVGIPALAFALLAVLVLGGSARTPRYRPGRAWAHEDVWYLPRPPTVSGPSHAAPALTGGAPTVGSDRRTARGGASGTW